MAEADRAPAVKSVLPSPVAAALEWIAAVALLAMIAVTTVDVIGRYIFARPLPGAYQIIEVLMAVLIFTGLPLVTASREHLSAGLINTTRRFVLRLQDASTQAVGAIFCGLLAYQLFIAAGEYAATGQKLDHTIRIPMSIIAYFMMAMTLATMAVFLALLFRRSVRS
jgi:TRAP-type C4-dicarboxylate transport system permease small subunit